jgi:outer membrane protein
MFDNGMYIQLEGLTVRANLMPKSWVPWLKVGPIYNYRASRSSVDNDQVDKLKNVSDAHELGGFVGFEYANWFATVEFLADTAHAYAGSYGTLKGGYNWLFSDSWSFLFGAHTTYASENYFSTYFGVSESDSLRSGLDTYDADDDGFKDVGLDLGANWSISRSWDLRGIASYSLLVGDADDDSPVTDEGSEHQFFGGVLVVFKF